MNIQGFGRRLAFLGCCLVLCGGLGRLDLRAQGGVGGVPGAIKYQAVLRDLEGEPMANRSGLAVRVTLRQGSPGGTILYREEHADGLTTNAFGLLQLEIGRGEASEAAYGSLLDIPWENSPIYAEIEVQTDDNGYTMLGASELLSVPYALYAGNANVGLGLDDGVVPKYDAGAMGLVNSRISEQPDGAIMFQTDKNAYFFPTERGRKGQSLTLIDEAGQLGWREVGGGSGGVACPTCKDGYLVYYDQVADEMKTSDMRQETDGTVTATKGMVVQDVMEINATVSGENNLQYKDLQEKHVWVGNDRNQSEAYLLGTGVNVDAVNKRLDFVGGGGSAGWIYDPVTEVVYAGTGTEQTEAERVGVGTKDPQTRFHLQDGSLLLSGGGAAPDPADPALTAGNHLYWHSGKGALRMGRFDVDASTLWSGTGLGANSIALGTNAKAGQDDNVAIGKETDAQGKRTMVFGQNVAATGDTSLALGHNVLVSGKYAVGLGVGYNQDKELALSVAGSRSVGIGYDVKVGPSADESVVIGAWNELKKDAAESVLIGKENTAIGKGHVLLGKYNTVENENGAAHNILIGTNSTAVNNSGSSIVMGSDNTVSESNGSILLGNWVSNTGAENAICVGTGVTNGDNHWGGANSVFLGNELHLYNDQAYVFNIPPVVNIGYGNSYTVAAQGDVSAGPVLLGYNLATALNQGVILGRYNTDPQQENIALVVGNGTDYATPSNVMELYDDGSMWIAGNLTQNSDLNLKTDIRPLNADFSVLQALQPVRYRFKADKKQQLQFGFIAQEVEQYFPHLVSTGNKGLKSLNYIGLLPVLWQYTQQLEQTVESQAAEIDRLQSEVERMKADLEAIKAALNLD